MYIDLEECDHLKLNNGSLPNGTPLNQSEVYLWPFITSCLYLLSFKQLNQKVIFVPLRL